MKLKEFTKRLGTTALICSLLLAQSTPAFAAEISAAPAPSAEEQLTAAPGQEAESTPSAESPEENTPEEDTNAPASQTPSEKPPAENESPAPEPSKPEAAPQKTPAEAELPVVPETQEDDLVHAEASSKMYGGYIPGDLDKAAPVYDSGISTYSSLPSSYQSDLSRYPDTRDQNPYGTCWAFSTLGLAEYDLINKGYVDASIDLSELQLVYFTFNSVLDPLGGTEGDQSRFYNHNNYNFLNYGGNYESAARRLAQWSGAAKENTVPYSLASEAAANGLAEEYAYQHDAFLMKNAYLINLKANTDAVKSAIMEHGAAGVMYLHNNLSMLWNEDKGVWTYYDTDYSGGGHAVMLVGWDDGFSRENFLGTVKPEHDGAWLIRNSWGNYVAYFWMSYETASLTGTAWIFDFDPADTYDNNYQLDGGLSTYYDSYCTKEANVFQVQEKDGVASETLKAVQLSFTHQADVGYRVEIYTDLQDPKKPLSGTKQEQATTDGQTAYAGIYTVDLAESVSLTPGSYFSIVVSLDKHALDYEQAISYADGEDLIWSCPAVSHGDSFYSYNGQDYYAWTYGNFSIKALTSNEQTPAPDVPVNPVDPRDALAAEHRGDVPDGTYFIQSAVNQGYVLDVRWASGDNRANVQLYEKNDSNAQRWRISHDENGYLTLTNAGSGKVLDVNSAGTANETNIQQYESNGTRAQKWIGVKQSDESVVFLSALDEKKCVDLRWGSAVNETNIQLYETNGSKAQRWVLSQNSTLDDLAYAHRNELKDGVYTIQSAVHRGYVLDVSGGSHSNYANVQLYQSNGTGAQKWRVSHDAKGYMTLTCVGSGKVLDVSGANTANETNIQQYESNGTKAQKWIAVRQLDGSMDLVSALDRKKRVDLRWGTIANGTNIQLYDSNGTKAQRWVFAN